MDKTDIVILLDRSGSMQSAASDHEGGIRSFLRDQKTLPGDVRLTFIRFDSHDPFEIVFDRTPITEINEDQITLNPRGGTPLLTAMGDMIEHLEKTLPTDLDQVVIFIVSDGMTNGYNKYSKEQVQQMVAKHKDKWVFMYLGANVDEFGEAATLNVDSNNSAGYVNTSGGVAALYGTLNSKVRTTRSALSAGTGNVDLAAVYNFTEEERDELKEQK